MSALSARAVTLRTPSRAAAAALPWMVCAAALSAGVGVAVAEDATWLLISIALPVGLALAILRWPFPVVALLLIVRAAMKNPFVDLLTLAGGALALAIAAPRLPGHRVILPLGAFLLFVLPFVPISPSHDEGLRPAWLYLPKTSIRYLPQPSAELEDWLRLASVLVAFMLTAWAVRDARRLRRLVAAVLVSAVVPVVIGLKQLAQGELVVRAGFKAIQGPFTHPNYFAFYLVVILTLGLVAFIEDRRLAVRAPLAGLLAAALLCLFETYTRSAWIGFCGVVLLLGVLRYKRLFVAGALALVVAAFAFPSSVHKVEQRFGDLSSRSASASSNSWTWRTGEWRRMLPYGYRRPFTGQGYGSYNRLTVQEFGTQDPNYPTIADRNHPGESELGFAAHNDYVRAFVEDGVPGLVLWVLFLTGLVAVTWRGRRAGGGVAPYACAGVAIGCALIVMSGADNISGYTVVLVYAAALAGAVAGATRRARG
ncbi:MAG TPA: O-antigen ligase family protein, partial [Thermoleophilaceae bacterium]|nr:O-antigen ligase family protein [Thermoleophilaceae bacterium]